MKIYESHHHHLEPPPWNLAISRSVFHFIRFVLDGAKFAAKNLLFETAAIYSVPRKRGSSASRSPSPIRLKAATVSRIASPGNNDSQG